MKSRLFLAVICALVLIAVAAPAQDPAETEASAVDPLEAEGEVEETWDDYKVKAYTIQVFGGMFSGDEYLNLPVKGSQTQVTEGDDRIMSYDGTWFEDSELDYTTYDGPIKELETGITFGMKIGTYLADRFHLDMVMSYTATEAALTMVNQDDPDDVFREEIDRDDNVQILRGSLQMVYDLDDFSLLGFSPFMGFGFGGVINRFSNLDDVGGLFLVGTAGLRRPVTDSIGAFLQFDATTFAMGRDELHYTKTVLFTDVTAGISFYVDTVPGGVRELHEAELAEHQRSGH